MGFQSLALAGSTGIGQLIMALLYVWSARSAGPEQFGQYVTAIAIGTAAVGFIDFGTNSYWVRELAAKRLATESFGKRLANKLLFATVIALIWITLWTFVIPGTTLAVAGAIVLSSLVNQSLQISLRAAARADLVSISIFSDKLVALGIYLSLVALGVLPVDALWVSLTAGAFCAGIMGWFLTPSEARPILRFSWTTNPWAGSGHYGIANAAISAQAFDTPIMTLFGGASAAGAYAAVARWTQPMGLLANAFASAAAPHIARAKSPGEAWIHIRKSVWLPALAILFCLVIFFTSPVLVVFLVGPEYQNSVIVLQVLALGTMPAIVNQPLFIFLQSSGYDRPVSFLAIAMVLIQLGLVAILALQYGALGGALAAAGTQVLMLCGHLLILVFFYKRKRVVPL